MPMNKARRRTNFFQKQRQTVLNKSPWADPSHFTWNRHERSQVETEQQNLWDHVIMSLRIAGLSPWPHDERRWTQIQNQLYSSFIILMYTCSADQFPGAYVRV